MNLAARARQERLEAEHIIASAAARDPETATTLEALEAQLGWLEYDAAADTHQIPFATWARVAAAFIRGGYPALVSMAVRDGRPTRDFSFALAFLESYNTAESATALAQVVRGVTEPWSLADRECAASAVNLLFSFRGAPPLSATDEAVLRQLVEDGLAQATTPADLATFVCALRGVGNAASLERLMAQPPLPYPWHDTVETATRALKRRLRRRGH